jgi:hypothetical protein
MTPVEVVRKWAADQARCPHPREALYLISDQEIFAGIIKALDDAGYVIVSRNDLEDIATQCENWQGDYGGVMLSNVGGRIRIVLSGSDVP